MSLEFPRMSLGSNNVRYKFGNSKKPDILTVPDPVPTITAIKPEAMKAGEVERRRLQGRGGRGSTIMTPGFMAPARVEKRELKTKFG